MKSTIQLYALIGSLILAIILWLYFTSQTVKNDPIFAATVNQDCAPWDGMAYTITIPDEAGSVVRVSIWQPADFQLPVMYSFPDSSGKVGAADYQSASESVQQVSGKITLQPFAAKAPIEGMFDFTLENGRKIKGIFKAKWGDQIALCG
jgi:hypothetical protein